MEALLKTVFDALALAQQLNMNDASVMPVITALRIHTLHCTRILHVCFQMLFVQYVALTEAKLYKNNLCALFGFVPGVLSDADQQSVCMGCEKKPPSTKKNPWDRDLSKITRS